MNLKYSQFNLVDEIKSGFYSIYNTKSRYHLVLNLSQYPEHHLILKQDELIKALSEKIINKLTDKGFIVRSEIDELSVLKQECFDSRFNEDHGLVLTVLPTFECNFRCPYCFEDVSQHKGNKIIDEYTQDNIVEFVASKLSTGIKGSLYVKWFGGEPLLAVSAMLDLTRKLKQVAKQYGNKYISSMLTNGYLLDALSKDMVDELSIFAIQVTLDGPEEVHNKRRPHKTDKNSFKKIIDNLKHLENIVDHAYIRINADESNASSIPLLLKYLKEQELLKKCKYDIGYIDTQTGAYTLEPSCSALLNEDDIKSIYSVISDGLKALNLEDIVPREYPKKLKFACDAQIKNSFIVDPNGNVFKCLNDATIPGRAIFNLNSKMKINPEREDKFLNLDPYKIEKCQHCSYLPICHGGCPAKIIDLGEQHTSCWANCLVFRDKLIKQSKRSVI